MEKSGKTGECMAPDEWIVRFMGHMARTEEEKTALRNTFAAGYCWHFAHMLKQTFGRGEVCLAAPFGHMVWLDGDPMDIARRGISPCDAPAYDIDGRYIGEAYWLIPAGRLGRDCLADFRHAGGDYEPPTREDVIHEMKGFCRDAGIPYDPGAESFLN